MAVYLPPEILSHIISYIPPDSRAQRTLHACTLVSLAWYRASIERLYQAPHIKGSVFALFVRTICPSVNPTIRKSDLALMVRNLDLGELVYESTKSLTARVLGRLKENIEVFRAPQASFGVSCLSALSHCHKLYDLDLSLVCEAIPLVNLFHSLSKLPQLLTFRVPKSSMKIPLEACDLAWPAQIQSLDIRNNLLRKTFSGHSYNNLQNLVLWSDSDIGSLDLISQAAPNLKRLELMLSWTLSYLSLHSLLKMLPSLLALTVATSALSPVFFISNNDDPHPLQELVIKASDSEEKINTILLYECVEEGPLKALRLLQMSKGLINEKDKVVKDDLKALDSLLEERAEQTNRLDDYGVFFFEYPAMGSVEPKPIDSL